MRAAQAHDIMGLVSEIKPEDTGLLRIVEVWKAE
jgi:hypothetical protein